MHPKFIEAIQQKKIHQIIQYLEEGVPGAFWSIGSNSATNVFIPIQRQLSEYKAEENIMHMLAEKDILHKVLPQILEMALSSRTSVTSRNFLEREKITEARVLNEIKRCLSAKDLSDLTPIHILFKNSNQEAISSLINNCKEWKIDLHSLEIPGTSNSTSTKEYAKEHFGIEQNDVSPAEYALKDVNSTQKIIRSACMTPDSSNNFLQVMLKPGINPNETLSNTRSLFKQNSGIENTLTTVLNFNKEEKNKSTFGILNKIYPDDDVLKKFASEFAWNYDENTSTFTTVKTLVLTEESKMDKESFKKHENTGMLELMTGNKEYKENNYDKAIASFKNAIKEYSQAGDEQHIVDNIEKAYLNLSASYIAGEKYNEAIDIIKQVKKEGYVIDAYKQNLATAYHNLALRSFDNDQKEAEENFIKANKIYPDNPDTLYNLARIQIGDKSYNKAEEVLNSLFSNNITENKFPLALKLNALCKLVECQLALNKDTQSTLEQAADILLKLDQTNHKEEVEFVYSHLATQYLLNNDPDQVKKILEYSGKADKSMPETLATKLEQHILYNYNQTENEDNKKNAIKMLITLANVKHIVNEELLETIKSDLVSISKDLHCDDANGFLEKVLTSIDTCVVGDVDDLFA